MIPIIINKNYDATNSIANSIANYTMLVRMLIAKYMNTRPYMYCTYGIFSLQKGKKSNVTKSSTDNTYYELVYTYSNS